MKNLEDLLQIVVATFLRKLQLQEDFIFHHSPNGGKRSKAEASRFKMMGVLAGFPDLFFMKLGKIFFIELKTDKGATHKAQDVFIEKSNRYGFNVYVIHASRPEEVLEKVIKVLVIEFGFNQKTMSSISANVCSLPMVKSLFKSS